VESKPAVQPQIPFAGGVRIWRYFATASTVLEISLSYQKVLGFATCCTGFNPVQTGANTRPKAGVKVYGEVTL